MPTVQNGGGSSSSASEGGGGSTSAANEELGSDEVKVFKDEGDDDRDASTSEPVQDDLSEEKSSLIGESAQVGSVVSASVIAQSVRA